MKEITIVTAFFDIGRDKYAFLSRAVDKYVGDFSFWARMQNKLIVYTSPELATKVMEIRRGFGLEDRTVIIEIPDIFEVEPALYKKMQDVEKKPDFLNFRENNNPQWPENKANYDYVVMMKYWCIQDAVKRGIAEGLLGWIDFGFNHGGECFVNPEEFDFLWECEISEKINIFCLKDPDTVSSVLQLQYLSDCIMSGVFIVSSKYTEEMWNLVRAAMIALVSLDCIDDDQQLLLMAYRMNPEIFEVHLSNWFLPLKEYGGNHLTITDAFANPGREKQVSIVNRIRGKLGVIKKRLKYCKRIYDISKRYAR